jgi:hypothetical protein
MLNTRSFAAAGHIPVYAGIRGPMRAAGTNSLRTWLGTNPDAANTPWPGDSVTPVLLNGPLGTKLTIAVIGDGFARADQQAYDKAVDDLLVGGTFNHDFYAANKTAFNVMRINLVSADSGVSTKAYDPKTDAVTSQTDHDTALGMYFSGSWKHCWVESGPKSENLIQAAIARWVPDPALTMILLNNPGFGGCGGGGRLVLPLGVSWSTVAHELGHAFGGLGDEYHQLNDPYPGGEPGAPNLTTTTSKTTLKWSWAVATNTPIPTGSDDYTAGTKPSTWDDNQDVGLFEGGNGNYSTGIYRPVVNCRMRSNDPPFCPVCRRAMDTRVQTLVPSADVSAVHTWLDGGAMSDGEHESYLRLIVRKHGERLRIVDSTQVSGPLRQAPVLPGDSHAHELHVGDRLVATAGVPDVAERRSFSEPESGGPREYTTARGDDFDFVVRVPSSELRGADPSAITLRLFSTRNAGGEAIPATVALRADSPAESTSIASMEGTTAAEIPESLRQHLRR